jgi:S1-C subfamily serine protease
MATENASGILASLSNELAAAVERASQIVVTVDARRQTAGSGVVWPAGGGVIVTADHVVERDEDINVILPGGQKVKATLAGRDPGSDVAVLRLAQGTNVPAQAELAPPDSAKIGHLVLAIGRPGEGKAMATFGVVSAVGGTWRTARGGIVEGYVRADVALYPGFSGGPLVDTQGRVVGLNSWYLARGQELAIPAQAVGNVVQTLLTQGTVRRGYLGITSQPVAIPAALRQKLGLTQESGLVVVGVESGSPAEQGGLVLGDVLLSLAGRAVSDAEDLQATLATGLVGKPTPLVILRGGERKELTVTPGERK